MRTAVKFEPEVLNLGQMSRDSGEIKKTVTIRKGDGGPIKPEIIPTTNQNTTVALREIEAGESYELDFTIAPPWPGGRLVENVRLKTGVTEAPETTFMISGSLPPRLTATPRYFTFPMKRNENMTETVRLNWSDNKPGKIESMTTTLPGGQVKVEGEGAEQVVSLTVPAEASGTRGQMQVVLKTDDQAVPDMRIPIVFREKPWSRSKPLRIPSGPGEQAKGADKDVPKREEQKQ